MVKKILFLVLFVVTIVGFYCPSSYSQTPQTYELQFANDVQTAANVYEFDIYLLNTSTTVFKLYGVQIKISFNSAALNGGTLTLSWVPGSNDAGLVASNQVNTLIYNAAYLRVVSAPASSMAAAATISQIAPGTILGRLRLTNSVNFAAQSLNLGYLMTTPFKTTVAPYDLTTGLSSDITLLATNNVVSLSNPILPVELSSFLCSLNGRQINLNWETKTEVNSNKYEIERALVSTKDASLTWTSVGSVKAAGSSYSPKKYSFTEKNLQAGKYQYRLKMVDNDGSFKYSSIVSAEVSVPKDFAVSQNYPNPFNPTTKIDYQVPVDAKVVVEVYNITGQRVVELVNQEQSAGYYTVNFGSSNLSSGVYIYRVVASDKATGNNFSSIKKMMLLK
jgi:hypothetical protein